MNDKTTEMIQGAIQQIQEQLGSVEAQIQEFEKIINDIDEYTKTKEDSEILAPISNGIFVKAKILDTKTFTINVGSDTLVEKTPEQTTNIMHGQIKNLQNFRDELLEELDQNYKRLN